MVFHLNVHVLLGIHSFFLVGVSRDCISNRFFLTRHFTSDIEADKSESGDEPGTIRLFDRGLQGLSLLLLRWSPASAPWANPGPYHRVPSDKLLLASPKDSQIYTIKILPIGYSCNRLRESRSCCYLLRCKLQGSRQGPSQQVPGDTNIPVVISILSWFDNLCLNREILLVGSTFG